jgi:zinc transport system permease protein
MLAVLAAPPGHWLDNLLHWLAGLAPPSTFFAYSFNIRALLALILVSLACGAVGSLVVAGRMAFFSDALAHCSFASVSIGFVLFTTLLAGARSNTEFWDWVTPLMIVLGMLTGFGIAAVRERTGLASDTVIGVFFAFAIGLAATLRKVMQSRQLFSLEDFLFGDPLLLTGEEVVWLAAQLVLVVAVLAFIFNPLLLSGVSTSLALSRRAPARLASYVFIMLLAVVVNLCVRTVGVLLINALLVVPAATAFNVARNVRQVFWWTISLCVIASVLGQMIAWDCEARFGVRLGIPGAVILVSVTLFVVLTLLGPWLRRGPRPAAS